MKGEIQGCFWESGSLFAKRSLWFRVQSGWEGPWLKASSRLSHYDEMGEPEVKELQWGKQKEWKESGETKKVNFLRHGNQWEEGHGRERQNLEWTLRPLTCVIGRMMAFNHHSSRTTSPPTVPFTYASLLAISLLTVFLAPDFCTLHFLSQQRPSPLPSVYLVKYSAFKLNSVVYSENVPWLSPPSLGAPIVSNNTTLKALICLYCNCLCKLFTWPWTSLGQGYSVNVCWPVRWVDENDFYDPRVFSHVD